MQRKESLELVSRAGLAIMSFAVSAAANALGQLLRNAAAIDDEFRGYCIDVYGGGANARVDKALRVHSCKTDRYRDINGDQLFQWVDDFMGRVTMPEYDHCMEATALEPACHPAGQESAFRRRARHRGFSSLGSPLSLIGYQRLIDADDVART